MEIISLILNLLLSTGFIVTLVTLKSVRKKAEQEAKAVVISNEEQAMKTFQTYIVEPLKKDIKSLRNEITRFRKAIDKISDCDYADDCPVKRELRELREQETDDTDRTSQRNDKG